MRELATSIVYKINQREEFALGIGALAVVLALVGKFSYLGIASVLIGFLLHEMAHRYFARRALCSSRFVLDPLGLLLTIVSSFLPIAFLAPGYVGIYCYGNILKKRDMMRISAAGIMTNLVISVIAIALYNLWPSFFSVLSVINAWFALFNLIPIGPFDGAKIFKLNKLVWGAFFVSSLALYLFWVI